MQERFVLQAVVVGQKLELYGGSDLVPLQEGLREAYRDGIQAALDVVHTWCNDPIVATKIEELLSSSAKDEK